MALRRRKRRGFSIDGFVRSRIIATGRNAEAI
jgi:hypothetical protein